MDSHNPFPQLHQDNLNTPEKLSNVYHDIFDYPLRASDLKKWQVVNPHITLKGGKSVKINNKDFIKRENRKKISEKKLLIANKASSLLSKIPTVQFVGITGSLAMMNSRVGSDVDLLIITKTNTLWLTRSIVYLLLVLFGFAIRKPGDREEADRLCINMWLDGSDLIFKKTNSHLRNLFIAHEILQIKPLINKNKTHEKLLSENKWVYEYWKGEYKKTESTKLNNNLFVKPVNLIAYYFQKAYMKRKLTREVVTPIRAFFHPVDWSKKVEKELIKRGVKEEAG